MIWVKLRSLHSVLTWGVFECHNAHRRSVAILCLLYKIMCSPMLPLHGALTVLYVPVGLHEMLWSHICILMLLLAAEPRSSVLLLSPLSISVERFCWPCIRWCGTRGFLGQSRWFFIDLRLAARFLRVFNCFLLSVLFFYWLVLLGGGLRIDSRMQGWGLRTLPVWHSRPLLIIIIIIFGMKLQKGPRHD